ncbi:peptidase domain-containing ABC transporter [Pedobacter roseus]|uniref:Peptidase domain-containing ABC transporter n=1 Tax=Pedobacter roseus TaxID=336820 RepID=A0A7G9QDV9_9SPHI|nr:peptidase domain-containing ABC transporter [Pedobacter roseus]QNN41534.1 peptidase domain-containing ABC transporter [Pedobacter roseus]
MFKLNYRPSIPIYRQLETKDCGPTCLRMVLRYYGKSYTLNTIRQACRVNRDGSTFLGLKVAAEKFGMNAICVKLHYTDLINADIWPAIIHWKTNHFVVLKKLTKDEAVIIDPAQGKVKISRADFLEHWNAVEEKGYALILEPDADLEQLNQEEQEAQTNVSFWKLLGYLKKHKSLILQLLIGLVASSILELSLPFLSKLLIDRGIKLKEVNLIYLVLIGQVVVFASKSFIEFVRSWILLFVSVRVNLNILVSFFIKLLNLPLSFFETRKQGDVMQRVNDHTRIENFLTSNTLTTVFSCFNICVLSIILFHFSSILFLIFAGSSILYVGWVFLFFNKRRQIDQKRFEVNSSVQSKIVQLIEGFQDIKISNSADQKRWEWESLIVKEFKVRVKGLTYNQYQQAGSLVITEMRNIGITFVAAFMTLRGEISLGSLFAIQFIVGQLIAPIESLIFFLQSYQDTKMSLERLNEIHEIQDEQPETGKYVEIDHLIGDISIQNLQFSYPGFENKAVFNSLSLVIPKGKITAIVGLSGSGKTTLLKLLLKLYDPTGGTIHIGNEKLDDIDVGQWRNLCGTVLQDGFIFSDTIAKNIALGFEQINEGRLHDAIKMANIGDFVYNLPKGVETEIGIGANGISQGQRQRLLIARAVYKNPELLLFDEATNALDSNNEQAIMNNLRDFFDNRTVVIVAHRLSTIKNADQIFVMEYGRILESGNHETLMNNKGAYFNLINNQLEKIK